MENCNVTGNMSSTHGSSSDENVHNVMIYQSMSGGANGGNAEFTVNDQSLSGEIVVDTILALNFKLDGNSSFTGTRNIIPNEQNGTAVEDNITIEISEGSVRTLTGDCTITSLENKGKVNFNGHTITLADGTVLKE